MQSPGGRALPLKPAFPALFWAGGDTGHKSALALARRDDLARQRARRRWARPNGSRPARAYSLARPRVNRDGGDSSTTSIGWRSGNQWPRTACREGGGVAS